MKGNGKGGVPDIGSHEGRSIARKAEPQRGFVEIQGAFCPETVILYREQDPLIRLGLSKGTDYQRDKKSTSSGEKRG